MADSIDDLERAVEELISDAKWADTYPAVHEASAAQARELVRRLRAVAECAGMSGCTPAFALERIRRIVTGATGESEKGDG